MLFFKPSKSEFVKGAIAVNQVAQEFPELHFQVFSFEETPSVGIAQKGDEKYRNYCWIEQSNLTDKWLVIGCPPGTEDYRSLSVWKDKQKAYSIKQQLEPILRNFPLKDWKGHVSSSKYVELLESLPSDDDEVVGIFDRSNGDLLLKKMVQDK